MTAEEREALAAALPEHQSWCHGEAHAECCGAGDCDCGVADSLDRLLPVVDAIAQRRAAEELRVSFRWAADAYYHRPRADVHDWLWELGDTRADVLEAE